MATIKNLGRAIVREPEPAGAKIERKGLNGSDEEQTSRTPEPAGALPKTNARWQNPFPAIQIDARPVAGKAPRPTNRPGD
jgi:hypothetical protein